MSHFKVKSKRRDGDTTVTLDRKHIQNMDKIEKEKEEFKIKEQRLNQINTLLDTENDTNRILFLKDEKIKIEESIKLYTSDNAEINYFLDNGNLLFEYYNSLEKDSVASKNNIKKKQQNDISILEYFNKNIFNETESLNKKDLYNIYLNNTDSEFVYNRFNSKNEKCAHCFVEKIIYLSEGKQICPQCGDETEILIESDKPSYKDPPREITYFSYKRINHFNEWLAQFQAKETTEIPQDIYDSVIEELKKGRMEVSNLNSKQLRSILKKLKKNKYYEHIPHILNRLNGISPPIMSREIEEELRRMFREIQIPFHKYCPPERKNFLSYSYVLHKFVELLDLDEYKNCFVLLKSREKLHQQDKIWKQICSQLKWQYIPSV
jgi:hypothetical protein